MCVCVCVCVCVSAYGLVGNLSIVIVRHNFYMLELKYTLVILTTLVSSCIILGRYALAGFSFTAHELIAELRKRYPALVVAAQPPGGASGPAADFARAWPNSLSGDAAK